MNNDLDYPLDINNVEKLLPREYSIQMTGNSTRSATTDKKIIVNDTGYDYQTCYQAIADKQARAVIPPRRNGRVWANGQMDDRDDNLRRIAVVGRDAWKQESDYHQRSLAETGMFRLKKIFGPGLLARHLKRQQTEVRVRCVALNRMTALGMPDSYPLGLA